MDFMGLGSVADLIGKAVDKIWPDKDKADQVKLELFKAQQAGAFKELDAEVQLAVEQMKVNAVEAGSGDKYASRWRPTVGYIGCVGLSWNCLFHPMLTWWLAVYHPNIVPPPPIPSELLYGLIFGMLGIGGYRTYEKVNGATK